MDQAPRGLVAFHALRKLSDARLLVGSLSTQIAPKHMSSTFLPDIGRCSACLLYRPHITDWMSMHVMSMWFLHAGGAVSQSHLRRSCLEACSRCSLPKAGAVLVVELVQICRLHVAGGDAAAGALRVRIIKELARACASLRELASMQALLHWMTAPLHSNCHAAGQPSVRLKQLLSACFAHRFVPIAHCPSAQHLL